MAQEDIARAMQLALIDRSAEEQAALVSDVAEIISFVAAVQSVPEVDASTSGMAVNVFRDDVVTVPGGTFTEGVLARAPARFKDWFTTKRVL